MKIAKALQTVHRVISREPVEVKSQVALQQLVYILLRLERNPHPFHRQLDLPDPPSHVLPSRHRPIESELAQRQLDLSRDVHMHRHRGRFRRVERAHVREGPDAEAAVDRVQAPSEQGRVGPRVADSGGVAPAGADPRDVLALERVDPAGPFGPEERCAQPEGAETCGIDRASVCTARIGQSQITSSTRRRCVRVEGVEGSGGGYGRNPPPEEQVPPVERYKARLSVFPLTRERKGVPSGVLRVLPLRTSGADPMAPANQSSCPFPPTSQSRVMRDRESAYRRGRARKSLRSDSRRCGGSTARRSGPSRSVGGSGRSYAPAWPAHIPARVFAVSTKEN